MKHHEHRHSAAPAALTTLVVLTAPILPTDPRNERADKKIFEDFLPAFRGVELPLIHQSCSRDSIIKRHLIDSPKATSASPGTTPAQFLTTSAYPDRLPKLTGAIPPHHRSHFPIPRNASPLSRIPFHGSRNAFRLPRNLFPHRSECLPLIPYPIPHPSEPLPRHPDDLPL